LLREEFRIAKLTFYSDLWRRAVSRRALPCPSSYVFLKRHLKQESCVIAKMTAQCALYMGALKIFGTLWLRPRLLFPTLFHGLLLGSTLWMFIHNLKSVTLSVPGIIGGTQKIWAVPGYAHASFSPKFLMGFYSDWPCKINVPAKFEVCSFTRSWDNRGYPKNLGSFWIRSRSLFSKIFNGLLFRLVL